MTLLFRFLVLFAVIAATINHCSESPGDGTYVVGAWVALVWALSMLDDEGGDDGEQ